jgi:hypothetical protein
MKQDEEQWRLDVTLYVLVILAFVIGVCGPWVWDLLGYIF